MGVRADLGTAIRDALTAAAISGVAVYDAPADIVDLPAIVIEAGDPYIEPTQFRGTAYRWSFMIHLMTQRAEPASAYETIEDLRVEIEAAVRSMSGIPGPLAAPGPDRMNDIDTIEAAMIAQILTSEGR